MHEEAKIDKVPKAKLDRIIRLTLEYAKNIPISLINNIRQKQKYERGFRVVLIHSINFYNQCTVKTKSHIIVWKGNCLNTAEFVKVETRKSIAVNGYITGEVEGILFHVSYKLTIDLLWNIKAVVIDCRSDSSFKISLKKNKNNQWFNKKSELLSEFNDCTDIDISITPFTNSLPINRLNLPEGSLSKIVSFT